MPGKFLIFPNVQAGMPPVVLALLIIGAAVRIAAMNAGSLLPLVLAQSTNPSIVDIEQPDSNPAIAGKFDPISNISEPSHTTPRLSEIVPEIQTPENDWPGLLAAHSAPSTVKRLTEANKNIRPSAPAHPSRTTIQWLTTKPAQQTRFLYFNDTPCTLSPAG